MNATQTDFLRHLRSLAARRATGVFSDQQLLETFLHQRSEASFTALVQRHGPMVFGVCRRLLGHVQDAEDAFQATFLVLARQAASIRKHESVGSFLHGVARRIAEKSKRTAARRAAREQKRSRQPHNDPMEDITWRELRGVLDEELAKLPEQYRAPLVLCYLEARTQDEAARRLGWSRNTFFRRLSRARELLAQRLARRGLTLTAALTAPLLFDRVAATAVPPQLTATTVRASLASAMGNAVGGLVSAQVVALAEEGGKTLLASKLKWAFAVLVAVSMAAGGVLTHQTLANRSTAMQPAAQLPASPAKPAPTPPIAMDKAIEVKGRVLGPDGKPLATARLFLLSEGKRKKADVPVRATTDKEGCFRFTAGPADFGPQSKGVLVATAEGLGLDWIDVHAKAKSEEITLRLVADDVPITGRVLDLEGKPVVGATVQVRSVARRTDGEDLAAFIETVGKYLKEGTAEFQPGALDTALSKFQWKRLVPAGIDVPATVTTDADGRFRLTGFGRERVLELAVRGPTIGHAPLYAVTRNGPAKGWISGNGGLYGARFEWLAVPCKPIVGTVRDKRTGKPIAGITVGVSQALWITAKTDNQGRYRLLGAAKSKEYDVGAGSLPYFNSEHHVADTAGLEPITVDFELERGIIVRGRLSEKTTGKPVPGGILYVARSDNPHLKDFADARKRPSFSQTSADGSFAVTVIPGPGELSITADDVNRFARAEGRNNQCHAVVPINPSEKDPKSTTYDIVLEPARTLKGSVLGSDDRPLAGAYAAGCWPIVHPDLFAHEKLDSHTFIVGGVKPGRPRTLAFYHREKKLGKVLRLQGDETKPLEVRLEPPGAIAGRILDARGRPWAGLHVMVIATLKDKTHPPEFRWVPSSWFKLTLLETTTDREGKFRVDGLLPGLKYDLTAAEGEVPPELAPYRADDLTVEAGKTNDMGDLKSKLTPETGAKEKP